MNGPSENILSIATYPNETQLKQTLPRKQNKKDTHIIISPK